MTTTLTPRLVVSDPNSAIDFYQRALGATLVERFDDPSGHMVHAALSTHQCTFSLTEEKHDWGLFSPASKGSAVLLYLLGEGVDTLAGAFLDAGGRQVIPLEDRFYGHREGRFSDPEGHLWILSELIEQLTQDQVRARMEVAVRSSIGISIHSFQVRLGFGSVSRRRCGGSAEGRPPASSRVRFWRQPHGLLLPGWENLDARSTLRTPIARYRPADLRPWPTSCVVAASLLFPTASHTRGARRGLRRSHDAAIAGCGELRTRWSGSEHVGVAETLEAFWVRPKRVRKNYC